MILHCRSLTGKPVGRKRPQRSEVAATNGVAHELSSNRGEQDAVAVVAGGDPQSRPVRDRPQQRQAVGGRGAQAHAEMMYPRVGQIRRELVAAP